VTHGDDHGAKPRFEEFEMSMRWIKVCTLTAVVAGVFSGSSFAADEKKADDKKPADGLIPVPVAAPAAAMPAPVTSGIVVGGGCGAVSAPTYTTVTETVMVPTTVAETRTVLKPVTRAEAYTGYRTEYVNEVQPRQVTVNRMVTETVNVTRAVQKNVTEVVNVTKTIARQVPVTKTVMVNQTSFEMVSETKMVSRTVRNVTRVPETINLGPSIVDRVKAFKSPCYCPCPRSVTICKRQVTCDTVCEPVTTCRKVPVTTCVPTTVTTCETVCETVTVPTTVTRCITVNEVVPTTVTKCVPTIETQNVTVCVAKQVPFPCTRNVCTMESVTETVNVIKCVPTTVTKQVLVAGCGTGIGSGCGDACGTGFNDVCSTGPAFGSRIKGLLAKKRCFVQGLFNNMRSGFGGMSNRGCGCNAAPACGTPLISGCNGCN